MLIGLVTEEEGGGGGGGKSHSKVGTLWVRQPDNKPKAESHLEEEKTERNWMKVFQR